MSRLSFALTVAALLGAILILLLSFRAQVFDRDDEGSSEESGEYEAYRLDMRECLPDYGYTNHCYVVSTEADDEQRWAYIVEDLIAIHDIWETGEKMVFVRFGSLETGMTVGEAYAFRSEAIAKEELPEEQRRSATVIDGVYIFRQS
jgi:hypothetical protein